MKRGNEGRKGKLNDRGWIETERETEAYEKWRRGKDRERGNWKGGND